jgi:O-antigen/teichoic acid export membrane protein
LPPVTEPPATTPQKGSSGGTGGKVLLNALAIITGRGLSLVFSAAAAIILARYLGTRLLGEYGAIYAYLSLYSWLASFGLEWMMMREISRRREEGANILVTGVVAGAAMAAMAALLALAVAPWAGYAGHFRLLLVFAAVDTLILVPLRLAGTVFQVDLKQWYSSGINVVRQGLWIGVVGLLVVFQASLTGVILARLGCSLVEVALLWGTAIHLKMLRGRWKLLPGEIRGYLAGALPIAFSALALNLFHRIDQVMLHTMAGDAVLGPYVAAVNITELFTTLPVALMAPMFPLLARAWREDKAGFERDTDMSFRLLMAIVFLLCPLVTLFAGPVVGLLYGVAFRASGPLLAVLIWSEAAVFFEVVLTNAIVARDLQRFLPLATMMGAAVNIALNAWWIPRYGAMGSAWATNISYTLAWGGLFLLFRETRPLTFCGLRSAARPFVLAMILMGIFLFTPVSVWWKAALAVPAYVAGLLLTGNLRAGEARQFGAILGQLLAGIRSRAA